MSVPSTVVDRHEGNATFHQTSCQQAALANVGAPVTVARLVIFLSDIKRVTSTLASDHLKRLVIKLIAGCCRLVQVKDATFFIQGCK